MQRGNFRPANSPAPVDGRCLRSFDNERRIRVAVKALPNVDATTLYLFKNEFRALTGISHPNLAELYELFSVGKQWFFTMELVRGADFLEYVRGGPAAVPDDVSPHAGISSSPKLDLCEATMTQTEAVVTPTSEADHRQDPPLHSPAQFDRLRSCTVQLMAGMDALHNAGKLHRDIKPSNVLVTRAGRVVLLDFGLVTDLRPADEATAVRRGGTLGIWRRSSG